MAKIRIVKEKVVCSRFTVSEVTTGTYTNVNGCVEPEDKPSLVFNPVDATLYKTEKDQSLLNLLAQCKADAKEDQEFKIVRLNVACHIIEY